MEKSIYRARQAGGFHGSVLQKFLFSIGFQVSSFDARPYLLNGSTEFLILAVVVDDITISNNSHNLLAEVRDYLASKFDVKFCGAFTTVISWTLNPTFKGIKIDKKSYVSLLLHLYGMDQFNAVLTPLTVDIDMLLPGSTSESMLSPDFQSIYRHLLGGLLYLGVSIRRNSKRKGTEGASRKKMRKRYFNYLRNFKKHSR